MRRRKKRHIDWLCPPVMSPSVTDEVLTTVLLASLAQVLITSSALFLEVQLGFHICLNSDWYSGPAREEAENGTVYEWKTETQVKNAASCRAPGSSPRCGEAQGCLPSLLHLLWAPGNFGSGISSEKHPAQPIWWKEPGELNTYRTPYALCFSSGPSRAANTCKMGNLLCSEKYGQEKLGSDLEDASLAKKNI